MSVVCCQVEVLASGRLRVEKSPADCGVSECDFETSKMRRPRHSIAIEPWKKMKSSGDCPVSFRLNVLSV